MNPPMGKHPIETRCKSIHYTEETEMMSYRSHRMQGKGATLEVRGKRMSCSGKAVICCGLKQELVQDCVESKWLIFDQTPRVIYQANEVVSATGMIEESSSTAGMTLVTVLFSIGATAITSFTLVNRQSLAFTVVGFDTITLVGNASLPAESASGSFCITPRYPVF